MHTHDIQSTLNARAACHSPQYMLYDFVISIICIFYAI